MSASPLLAVRSFTLRAGDTRRGRILFEDLSFDVYGGERWVVLGPNGAGKSSLLAAMAGLYAGASGSVAIDGRPLRTWSPAELADRRAWCPQFWSDPFPATVLDTVQLARDRASGWHVAAPKADPTVRAVIERLDLAAIADADVRTLSGGERQRVAIATAVLQGTALLLFDEPAAHLDLGHRQVLVDLAAEHADRGGATVVSLHDLNLAWDLASHIVLLDGRGASSAGTRAAMMTPSRLSAAFGVEVRELEDGPQRRFWSGRAVGAMAARGSSSAHALP